MAQPYTPTGKDLDPGHPEAWAPLIIQERLGMITLPPDYSLQILGWANSRLDPAYRGFADGSDNWYFMLLAALLLAKGPVAALVQRMVALLEQQIGAVPAPPDIPLYGVFDGHEQLSSTYGGMRAGAVNAVLLECYTGVLRNQQQLIAACCDWNTELCSLLSRYTAPGPIAVVKVMRVGRVDTVPRPAPHNLWTDRMWISPVSGRSTPAHTWDNDLGPWAQGLGGMLPPIYPSGSWSQQVLGMCLRNSDWRDRPRSPNPKAAARVLVPYHRINYADGSRLVYMEQRPTALTPCVYFDYYNAADKSVILGYPWTDVERMQPDPDYGCSIERTQVVARTGAGTVALDLPDGGVPA